MVSQQQISLLVEQIVKAISPEAVVLFGSYAYGRPTAHSDVDLLIIAAVTGKASTASMELWQQLRPAFAVDLVVRDPGDVARRYEQWDPLIREALDRGTVLYERDGTRVVVKGGGRLSRRAS